MKYIKTSYVAGLLHVTDIEGIQKCEEKKHSMVFADVYSFTGAARNIKMAIILGGPENKLLYQIANK